MKQKNTAADSSARALYLTPSSLSGTVLMLSLTKALPLLCSRAALCVTSSPLKHATRQSPRSPWSIPASGLLSINIDFSLVRQYCHSRENGNPVIAPIPRRGRKNHLHNLVPPLEVRGQLKMDPRLRGDDIKDKKQLSYYGSNKRHYTR